MDRTLAPAGIAHYDSRLAEPSTLPASHAGSSPSRYPDPVINGGHDDVP
jgi:hypothetical protein